MTKTKRKSKSRSKPKRKASKPREKVTELNKLKKTLSDLYTRVNENLKVILQQTQMSSQDLSHFIELNGYLGLKKLPNLKIAEPILDEMIKTFTLYDKVATLVSRMQHAENTVFINEVEKKTLELETRVKQIEQEDKFYTERDKLGFYNMKQKWYVEKDHWERLKAEAQMMLQEDPEDENAIAKLTQAQRELDILNKKKNWARMQNIQPNITKYAQKVGKVVNMVQDSVQEISKPFAQIGGEAGYSQQTIQKKQQKSYKNEYEDFFGKVN